ncbi:MAG: citrate lyase subunit beta / citryl-CoA lyase [Gammaproteobacteria bacterium]|jgi:citrate lyase subunit beta/citryl-CoA lyase|nr:citrate lyase subunit beta / citryl-CoA lyase [Gammaproteobacteria bacterium]
MLRSLLFVPADSERKLNKAQSAGADALILDLEDSVMPDRKAAARRLAQEYLSGCASGNPPIAAGAQMWVRVNDLCSGELLDDLAALVPSRPAGIVLPKIRGPEDVQTVTHYLEALERANGIVTPIAIIALVTETPVAVLRMGELAKASLPRLTALTWGAEDLSAALGAGDPRLPSGAWRPVYEHARGQCLLAAHALGIEAIDSVYVDYRDPEGLKLASLGSRHDGFTGRLAIHPDQVAAINQAFTPSEADLALAHRIVAAFAAGAGAVSIDGKMYDIPHLKSAQRLIGSPL